MEVGEESRLRIGEEGGWRWRVIRSIIRGAWAFEKMGQWRGGGVRGGKDLKHNNNLFGNDDINNGNKAPSMWNAAANAKVGAAIGPSKASAYA